MTFAENLKRICTEQGTNPTALLKKIGLSTSKVAMWNGGSLPKQDVMLRLAQELGCSVMDFFEDENSPKPADTPQVVLDEDEEEIIRIFRTLGRRERHEFMAIAYDYEKRGINSSTETNAV